MVGQGPLLKLFVHLPLACLYLQYRCKAASSNVPIGKSTIHGCLGSDASDVQINQLLHYGGPNTTVFLCPGARIGLSQTIMFTAANQSIYTLGKPGGGLRATLTVVSRNVCTAVYGSCRGCDNVYLGYVQINGNRPALGYVAVKNGGTALLEFGGNSMGQKIEGIRAYEPRGWSAIHAKEGGVTANQSPCSSMVIKNNQIGPCGRSPRVENPSLNTSKLLIKPIYLRDPSVMRNQIPNASEESREWADGISLGCTKTKVYGNTVTDATDGGIVIFGAPGSEVARNTIVSRSQDLLGGINMVDFSPHDGDYTGVVVQNNTFRTNGAMMKIGIAIGTMVWGSRNSTSFRTFNGLVKNNIFSSDEGGYFGYGIAIAGSNSTVVRSNTFLPTAKFSGVLTQACFPPPKSPPIPHNLTYDPWTSSNVTIQSTTTSDTLIYLICIGPSAAGTRGKSIASKFSPISSSLSRGFLNDRRPPLGGISSGRDSSGTRYIPVFVPPRISYPPEGQSLNMHYSTV